MITRYAYNQLGHADHGWLDARHHFSFGRYHDPKRMGFGALRVINDDRVAAGAGFSPHPHDNMEIITYVRSGAITHKDSAGNEGRTQAGDVQVMSAGSGITHSEWNAEGTDTTLYQIWILPGAHNVAPRWDARAFPKDPANDALPVLVSGQKRHEGSGALFIHQDATIYGGRIGKDKTLNQNIAHQAYILVSEGAVDIDGTRLEKGDGAEVTGVNEFAIKALTDAEVLVIDVPR